MRFLVIVQMLRVSGVLDHEVPRDDLLPGVVPVEEHPRQAVGEPKG